MFSFFRKKANIEEIEQILFLLNIEDRNLKIEYGKFYQAIGKANIKTKKLIWLKYIKYYLNHLEFSLEESKNIKDFTSINDIVNLIIMNKRVNQIIALIRKKTTIIESKNYEDNQKIREIIKNLDAEKNQMIENIIINLETIKKEIPKKYRYNNLEEKEVEEIISIIDNKIEKINGMIKV